MAKEFLEPKREIFRVLTRLYLLIIELRDALILNRYNDITMSDSRIFWIVQLPKEMKDFFDALALAEGDKAYGAGSRYVKRVLYDFIREKKKRDKLE